MSDKDFTPSLDASQGLIFRQNILFQKIDNAVQVSNYNLWDTLLERVFVNLMYRPISTIKEDTNGEIISVSFDDKNTKVYKYFCKKIHLAKTKYNNAKNAKEKAKARSEWYHSLREKDMWLRELMQRLKLYLRENEKTPGSSLFGESFNLKRNGKR